MKNLGVYELGYECVSVYVDPNASGGSFNACHKEDNRCRITIGLDQPLFRQVVGVLIHEALELCLMRHHARYSPSNELANDHSSYLFSFGHVTLSESAFKVAELVESCRSDLLQAYKKRKLNTKEVSNG